MLMNVVTTTTNTCYRLIIKTNAIIVAVSIIIIIQYEQVKH